MVTWKSRKGTAAARSDQKLGEATANLLLLLIVIIGFGLRLWQIGAKSLWWDESLSMIRAQGSLSYILSNRLDFPGIPTTDQHPPGYFLLLGLFVRLFGTSDLVLRLPSAIFGTALVSVAYALGTRLSGRRVGLLAGLFVALSPFYVWYSQEARMYTMVTFLASMSIYGQWRAMTEHRWRWAVLAIVCAAMAAMTQYLYLLTFGGQVLLAILLWFHGRRMRREQPSTYRAHLKRRTLFLLVGVLILVLTGLVYRIYWLLPTLATYRQYVPLSKILIDALNSFSLGLSVSLADVWPLDLLFLLTYMLGVWASCHRPFVPHVRGESQLARAVGAALLLLPAVPLLAMWLFSLFIPIYTNSRYAIIASPMFCIALAVGVEQLLRWRAWVGRLVAILLTVFMGYSLQRYYYHERYQAKEDYVAVADLVTRNEHVGDVIIVYGPESKPAFMHYYAGHMPVVGWPEGGWSEAELTSRLESLYVDYDRVWLVRARTALSDPAQRLSDWFSANGLRQMKKGYYSSGYYLSAEVYLPDLPLQPEDWQGSTSLGIASSELALVDYELRYINDVDHVQIIDSASAQAALDAEHGGDPPVADGLVTVILYWQPRTELPVLRTSLRLVRDGHVWAQRDRDPVINWPSDHWAPGGVVRQDADLALPIGLPAGRYALELWAYEAGAGVAFDLGAHHGTGHPQATLGVLDVAPFIVASRAEARGLLDLGAALPTTFGGDLHLFESGIGHEEVAAGSSIDLDLVWWARKAPQADYALVVNWLDEHNAQRYSQRLDLSGARRATTAWAQGEMVDTTLHLAVPDDLAPGEYHLHLLVHVPSTDEYLWLRRAGVPVGRDLSIGQILVRP